MDFTWNVKAVVGTAAEVAQERIGTEHVEDCFRMQPIRRRQVLYPTAGLGSGYDFSDTVPKELIDAHVVDGTYVILVKGCVAYRTFNKVRHSAFCSYYQANRTPDPAHLNICTGGSEAD
jgi:hypothetical protein